MNVETMRVMSRALKRARKLRCQAIAGRRGNRDQRCKEITVKKETLQNFMEHKDVVFRSNGIVLLKTEPNNGEVANYLALLLSNRMKTDIRLRPGQRHKLIRLAAYTLFHLVLIIHQLLP